MKRPRRILLFGIFGTMVLMGIILFSRKPQRAIVVIASDVALDSIASPIATALVQSIQQNRALELAVVSKESTYGLRLAAGNRLRRHPITAQRITEELSSNLPAQLHAAFVQQIASAVRPPQDILVIVNTSFSLAQPTLTSSQIPKQVIWIGAPSEHMDRVKRLVQGRQHSFSFFPIVTARPDVATSPDTVPAPPPTPHPPVEAAPPPPVLDIYAVSSPSTGLYPQLWKHLDRMFERRPIVFIYRADTTIIMDSADATSVLHVVLAAPQATPDSYSRLFAPMQRHCKGQRPAHIIITGSMNVLTPRPIVDLSCLRSRSHISLTIAVERGIGRQLWEDVATTLNLQTYVLP
ncbi:MAG: hypothetical protein RML15_07400 [Bacteroidota bacterium]|nr:hypothetical protein [Candidatus Kapabacteria bacterium]MCX7936704.1 hypothetical protein [Chlorobiota bacterium]MDW8272218.1 hypothetical protein [Bacteroidota bacterium]